MAIYGSLKKTMAKYAITHKYIEFFMPKIINVSATFDNCAFHSIAAHLLAYKQNIR